MAFSFAKNKKWHFFPLLLLFLLGILIFNRGIAFDVMKSRDECQHYGAVLNLVIFLLLLTLFFFQHWREQNYQKKLLLFGLSALLVTTSLVTHVPFQASVLFVFIVSFFLWKERKIYRPHTFFWLLIIYFLINTVSLIWTNNFSAGLVFFRYITPLAFIPILFCCFRLEKGDFDILVLFLFRFSMIYMSITIATWVLQSRAWGIPLQDNLVIQKHSFGMYTAYDIVYAWTKQIHPTYNALSLLFSLSTGWFYLLKKDIKDNITITEFVFFLLASFLIAIISNSRFMLLSFFIVNCLGLIHLIKNLMWRRLMLVGLVLLPFIFWGKFSQYIQDPIRRAHYKATFEGIQENIILGTGLGGMTEYINKDNQAYESLGEAFKEGFVHIHSHNQILGDWLQTGIFGAISSLLILGYLFVYGIRKKDQLLLINFVLLLLLMNIEMPFIYISGIFYFVVVFSLLVKREHQETVQINFSK